MGRRRLLGDLLTHRIVVRTTLGNLLMITKVLDKNLIDFSIEQVDKEASS